MQTFGNEISKRNSKLYLLFIWVIAITIRIFLFTGYMNGDMGNYVQEAHNFVAGHYSVEELIKNKSLNELVPNANFSWQNLRLGVIIPVGLLMLIFGVNDFCYAIFSLGCFTVSFIVVYLLGKALVSELFGLLSVLLFSFIPQEINLSTVLLPHLPASTFMALSCFFLYKGIHGKKQLIKLFLPLSGFSLAIAYLIWEFSLLLIPVLVGYLSMNIGIKRFLFTKKFWLSGFFIGLGFLPLFCLETAYFYRISGVLFFRIKLISAMGSKWLQLHPIDYMNLGLDLYPKYMFSSYYFGVFFYLVCAGLLLIIFRSLFEREIRTKTMATMSMPVIWCCWLWLYLQFGSSSLSHYQPIYKMSQYLEVLSVPGSLIGAYFLLFLPLESIGKKPNVMRLSLVQSYLIILILVLYIGSSTICAYINFAGNGPFHPDMTYEHRIKRKLDILPPDVPIYTDVWTKHGLDFVFGYKRPIRAYNSLGKEETMDIDCIRGCLVINRIYLSSEHIMKTPIPAFVAHMPNDWKLLDKVPGRTKSIDIYIKN